MTQKKEISNKLKQDGYVDNFWCINRFQTTRLGAVINNLKKEGWVFDEKSGYLEGTKNWRYYLKQRPLSKGFPCPVPQLDRDCSGCTDRNSEGTHQGCTRQHGHVGCDHSA